MYFFCYGLRPTLSFNHTHLYNPWVQYTSTTIGKHWIRQSSPSASKCLHPYCEILIISKRKSSFRKKEYITPEPIAAWPLETMVVFWQRSLSHHSFQNPADSMSLKRLQGPAPAPPVECPVVGQRPPCRAAPGPDLCRVVGLLWPGEKRLTPPNAPGDWKVGPSR